MDKIPDHILQPSLGHSSESDEYILTESDARKGCCDGNSEFTENETLPDDQRAWKTEPKLFERSENLANFITSPKIISMDECSADKLLNEEVSQDKETVGLVECDTNDDDNADDEDEKLQVNLNSPARVSRNLFPL